MRERDHRLIFGMVQRAQEGDRHSFELLVARHGAQIRSLVQERLGRRLRRVVTTDDVIQDVFVNAWQSLVDFEWRGEGSFGSWLGGIAEHVIQNLARRHFRTLKRGGKTGAASKRGKSSGRGKSKKRDDSVLSPDPTPSQNLRRHERYDRLEDALLRLEPDHRKVIALARLQRLPVQQVARLMGRTPDAVSMLLVRALRNLRRIFGPTESFHLPADRVEQLAERAGAPADRPPEPFGSPDANGTGGPPPSPGPATARENGSRGRASAAPDHEASPEKSAERPRPARDSGRRSRGDRRGSA